MVAETMTAAGEQRKAVADKVAEARAVLHQASVLASPSDAASIDAYAHQSYAIENDLRNRAYGEPEG